MGFKAGSVSLAPTCNSEFMLHMCQTVSEAAPTYERKRKAPVVEAGCHAASSHIINKLGIIRLHVTQDPEPAAEEEVWELEASA